MTKMEKAVNSLLKSYENEYKHSYMWSEWVALIDLLKQNGYAETMIFGHRMKKQNKQNLNYVYHKEGAPYVFVMIYTSSEKLAFPLIIDTDTYMEKVDFKHISIMKHHHRPLVAEDRVIRKLHKYVMDMEDISELEIDHVTHSSNICIKNFMRVCDRVHNRYNMPIYMTITENDEFTCLVEAKTDEDKRYLEELNYKGFYVEEEGMDKYRITSDEYDTEDKMIKDIQKIEKKLLKDYRYDPILDCTHPISQLLMFRYCFGFLTKAEFEEGQKYLMKQLKDDFFLRYYSIA